MAASGRALAPVCAAARQPSASAPIRTGLVPMIVLPFPARRFADPRRRLLYRQVSGAPPGLRPAVDSRAGSSPVGEARGTDPMTTRFPLAQRLHRWLRRWLTGRRAILTQA